ncbi:putative glycosyltransferase [Apostasia shenzhenica]|uniref:Putative glycosyltransferase n=1 Tax=Apostasia shenzhenica TaxID=1088818 RepID=A0A2H9ZX62_9ASPA|nr:putative glycosyltransferase [Apostasia shenzhenica]
MSPFSSWVQLLSLLPLLLLPTALLLLPAARRLPPANPSAAASSPALPTLFPHGSTLKRPERNKLEEELSRARSAIRRAGASSPASRRNFSGVFPLPRVYRNPAAFYRSYVEMERRFKVYVYEEGEPPLVHEGPCKNIYTTEGRFIAEMEALPLAAAAASAAGGVRTADPRRAHAFFLPFSVAQLVRYVYRPLSYDHAPIRRFVSDYVAVVAAKHPFWNRSAGADHFMLSCHDWGPHASRAHPSLYGSAIRALCNANTSEGFRPRKDVSIPEINLVTGELPPMPPPPPPQSPNSTSTSSRPLLAFFAGGLHGPIRPILLHHWKNRDPDLAVYEYLPAGAGDYFSYMRRSRFCLCPSGYEVASPRVVEAIYSGCIPAIISEGYVLPFSDVLRWEEFSVTVAVADLPRLKEALAAVPKEEVRRLRAGVRAVRRHFVLNHPPERFDAFYMILHSVWLRRLNIKVTEF